MGTWGCISGVGGFVAISQAIRRFLERPGSVDVRPLNKIVAEASRREERVKELTDLPKPPTGESTGDLAEFCAIAREAARRTLDMRPYDVQLLGTLALLSGHVAEMATGEGKTLSGALAAAGFA